MRNTLKLVVVSFVMLSLSMADEPKFDYRVLATSKTSTMEKEMNEAADAGYSFAGVMGGESSFGGKEVVVIMAKDSRNASEGKKKYKLLATAKTSTMKKELQEAGDEGFDYCGQTVFESAFGGKEVSLILVHDSVSKNKRIEYRLLATSKTSTMQKELREAGDAGFQFLGVMLGKTAFGGKEVISVLKRVAN